MAWREPSAARGFLSPGTLSALSHSPLSMRLRFRRGRGMKGNGVTARRNAPEKEGAVPSAGSALDPPLRGGPSADLQWRPHQRNVTDTPSVMFDVGPGLASLNQAWKFQVSPETTECSGLVGISVRSI